MRASDTLLVRRYVTRKHHRLEIMYEGRIDEVSVGRSSPANEVVVAE